MPLLWSTHADFSFLQFMTAKNGCDLISSLPLGPPPETVTHAAEVYLIQ